MDPFTALGLAGNILQIIQFSSDVFLAAREIQKSGNTKDNTFLENTTRHLTSLTTELESLATGSCISDNNKSLISLASDCHGLADEILVVLAQVKAKPGSQLRSIMASIKNVKAKGQIKELEDRLERCKSQLTLELSKMTRSETLSRLNEILEHGRSNSEEISSLQRNVAALRQGVNTMVSSIDSVVLEQLRSFINMSGQAIDQVRQTTILDAVRFDLMNERFEDIAIAHENTFQWIFDQSKKVTEAQESSRIRFTAWLRDGHGVFHISGKAGAGKSTLMKFLRHHSQTRNLLDIWAGEKQLVVAHFFFWKPGNTQQRNLKGLVRALLYQLLKQSPDLMPLVLKDQWESAKALQRVVVDDSEAITAFEQLIRIPATYQNRRLVYFIDGLDEFEGDHRGMIKRLLEWTRLAPGDIKLCLSSREWNIFMDAFSAGQRIRIHDLTRSDMEQLINDELAANALFLDSTTDGDRRHRLCEKIIETSDGIFLWVTLVLRGVLDALDNAEDIDRLERKIAAMPPDIEDMLNYLLNSIEPSDRELVYPAFGFQLLKRGHCTLLRHSFLTDLVRDCEFARKLPVGSLTPKNLGIRIERARKQINGLSKGLLEVVEDTQAKNQALRYNVTFTHRSIIEIFNSRRDFRDYLETEKDSISKLMCEAILAEMKVVDLAWYWYIPQGTCYDGTILTEARARFKDIIEPAANCSRTGLEYQIEILRIFQEVTFQRSKQCQELHFSDLKAAVTCGHGDFYLLLTFLLLPRPDILSAVLEKDMDFCGHGLGELLLYLIVMTNQVGYGAHTIAIMELLFAKGISPHARIPSSLIVPATGRALDASIWHLFLAIRAHFAPGQQVKEEDNIIECWIRHGVDPTDSPSWEGYLDVIYIQIPYALDTWLPMFAPQYF